ncbi:hypothetical protein B0H21DRAFT_853327 [Amylocystis lapponica]|nr:hypothetical protein B0H21DRAFT_853327 [Amylocystis lapponica]
MRRFAVLEVVRYEEFSPLKNAPGTGSDDPESSRRKPACAAQAVLGGCWRPLTVLNVDYALTDTITGTSISTIGESMASRSAHGSIPLPTPHTLSRVVFICANSLISSNDVVGARTCLHVIETLFGAHVLARQFKFGLNFRVYVRSIQHESTGYIARCSRERLCLHAVNAPPIVSLRPDITLALHVR